MGNLRVAVDVGGTFTDICILDADGGEIEVGKVPSTTDPIDAVVTGVVDAGIDLRDVVLFSHGTTVATNALITRNLPPAAMVTTEHFRDVIEIRRGTKADLWDAYADVAPPYIRRRDRFEVTERIDHAGEVVTPLDEGMARQVASVLRRRGIQTVAVCFINAHANPAHERRMREILEEELPGVTVSTSAEVLPEIFEHERFSTTVANAVLSPLISGYVNRLQDRLGEQGYGGDVLLLHSGGGVMTPKLAERFAVRLAASGIAAGAIASRHLSSLCGFPNAIGFDMGGTSTDVSLVYQGEERVTKEWFVEYGYPICFPSIEVLTIGAGGGSFAWIDEAGSLRNGPQSAGAHPGPACYGRGNDRPTNTDANLVLGRLGANLIGGAMELDRAAAEQAIRDHVAEPLGLDLVEAADAVIRVANANMADAMRLISIRRGYDPREFCLVAFGGAGPLHGAALAEELSIPTVLVPPSPGITSALGCLLVDVRHDLSAMFLAHVDTVDQEALGRRVRPARGRGTRAPHGRERSRGADVAAASRRHALPRPVAVADRSRVGSRRSRRRRQPLPCRARAGVQLSPGRSSRGDLSAERPRGRRDAETPAQAARADHEQAGADGVATRSFRLVRQRRRHAVLSPRRPAGGATLEGPAIVDQMDSTTVVPPRWEAVVDEWLNIRMDLKEA